MGSASREALAQARPALNGRLAQSVGSELLQAAGQITASPALAAALGDASAPADAKAQVVDRIFGKLSAGARGVLAAAVRGRWSNTDEFVSGIEELGFRADALAHADLSDELLAVADLVDSNHELQLSLGSKLIAAEGKAALISRLLTGKISASALAIVTHLVSHPRGRRLDFALRQTARVAADQIGAELATVSVAAPLTAEQQARLARTLEQTAGRPVKVTMVIDPELIGGIRIELADNVIDGSVRARLDDLRQQLAA